MISVVRGLAIVAFLLCSVVAVAPAHARRGRRAPAPRAQQARLPSGMRVSVQPFTQSPANAGVGELGPALRAQIARLLRERGARVLTSVPRVAGTGQYPSLAHDNRLAAFVTGDLEER